MVGERTATLARGPAGCRRYASVRLLSLLLLWVAGCNAVASSDATLPAPTPALPSLSATTPTVPVISLPSSQAKDSATPSPPPPDSGWQQLRPGLERRVINLLDDQGGQRERLYLLRLEPSQFEFSVAYRPGQPQSLSAWQAQTEALIVVNGGYFTESFTATGVIVIDGQASGVSYGDFAGMLAITADGPELRWLRQRPYDANEPLRYGLQSFPLLVKPGGQPGFREEDGVRSRRTVMAQDRNGRILFILASWGSFTLHELSNYLVASDLELDIALNLDGGTSTGLLLADPPEEISAFINLPTVIAVRAR